MNKLIGLEAKNKGKQSEVLVSKLVNEILEGYKDIVYNIVSEGKGEQMKGNKGGDVDIRINLSFEEVEHNIDIQVKHGRKSPRKIKSYEEGKSIYMIDGVNEKTEEELKYFIYLMFFNYLNKHKLSFSKMYK